MGYAVRVREEGATEGRVAVSGTGAALGAAGAPFAVREADAEYGSSTEGTAGAPGRGADRDPDRYRLRPEGPLSEEEVEELEALARRIGETAAHIHAAECELLGAIAEFDRRKGWKLHGYSSCAKWLAFWTGMDLRTARSRVRVARALERLPRTRRAMRRGELSFSKVRAIGRLGALEAEEEATMVEFARKTTAAELEKVVRQARYESRADEAARERLQHARRSFAVFPDEGGMVRVTGTLDPEVGAQLMRALEWAGEALYLREREEPLGPEPPTAEQRRADAVALLVERAVAAGLGDEDAGDPSEHGDAPEGGPAGPPCTCAGVAGGSASDGGAPPASVPLPERFQVFLHLDPEALVRRGDPRPTHSHLEDGTPVSVETARRLTCDGAVVPVVQDPEDGAVLDVGRRTRVVPPAIRRALRVRDGGCRWPGCGRRDTEPHHVVHWADGGPTSLDNAVSLCGLHHRAVHEDGFEVKALGGGRFRYFTPEGWPLGSEPPCVRVEADDPAVALVRRNRRRGIRPPWDAASADFPGEAHIPGRLLSAVGEVAAGRWLARGRRRGRRRQGERLAPGA